MITSMRLEDSNSCYIISIHTHTHTEHWEKFLASKFICFVTNNQEVGDVIRVWGPHFYFMLPAYVRKRKVKLFALPINPG